MSAFGSAVAKQRLSPPTASDASSPSSRIAVERRPLGPCAQAAGLATDAGSGEGEDTRADETETHGTLNFADRDPTKARAVTLMLSASRTCPQAHGSEPTHICNSERSAGPLGPAGRRLSAGWCGPCAPHSGRRGPPLRTASSARMRPARSRRAASAAALSSSACRWRSSSGLELGRFARRAFRRLGGLASRRLLRLFSAWRRRASSFSASRLARAATIASRSARRRATSGFVVARPVLHLLDEGLAGAACCGIDAVVELGIVESATCYPYPMLAGSRARTSPPMRGRAIARRHI